MERRWKIWKELLEEANGELEEEIRNLFLEKGENVVRRLVEGEELVAR